MLKPEVFYLLDQLAASRFDVLLSFDKSAFKILNSVHFLISPGLPLNQTPVKKMRAFLLLFLTAQLLQADPILGNSWLGIELAEESRFALIESALHHPEAASARGDSSRTAPKPSEPAALAQGIEYFVAPDGGDDGGGTRMSPFRTISAAADKAHPGDVITVQSGVYRERIDPPRGGTSEHRRIEYRAAEGAEVTIKGSEIVKGWKLLQNETWRTTVPNSLFGDTNPFATPIAGDWFEPLGGEERVYHTGCVYLNGHWLAEAADLTEVLAPGGDRPLWFAEVGEDVTTLYAQFPDVDPNRQTVEINVREAVFYPSKPGMNFITVRGFTLEQAAPNWAPPTAEQVGLIGTHWSQGWLIEDNTIRYSSCTGLALGKYGDAFDNRAESADGYVGTIRRALENGWTKDNIGHHLIRNNTISHCEQAGIVGSLGAIFSTIEGNAIHDINLRGMLGGHEMAGIKLHGAIDGLIANNRIYRCGGSAGIWLDWMSQGTRVTGNVLYENVKQDLFMEVNHGPYLIDNNIFLSPDAILDWSQGGAYVHNLIAGEIRFKAETKRRTPFFSPHSTEGMQLASFDRGDRRFFNNWIIGTGTEEAFASEGSLRLGGNLVQQNESWHLETRDAELWLVLSALPEAHDDQTTRRIITSRDLGKAEAPQLPYTQPDGTDYRLNQDVLGNTRNKHPDPGPFEISVPPSIPIQIWPVSKSLSLPKPGSPSAN